jgi:hypothetical protein
MPDVLDALAPLAGRPPRDPPPVAEIRARARERRRRRQRRRAGGAAVVLALVLGGTALALRPDHRSTVTIRPSGPTTTAPDGPARTSVTPDGLVVLDAPAGLRLDADGPLAAHDRVRATLLDDPGGELFVLQCAAGIVDVPESRRAGALDRCGPLTSTRPAGAPAAPVTIEVGRRLALPAGDLDCAAAPGVCVVAVRPTAGGDQHDRFAPLTFAGGPLVVPSVSVAGGGAPLADGEPVAVTGTGFAPHERLFLRQCLAGGDCDATGRARAVQADGSGGFTTDMLVFHDVGLGLDTAGPLVRWQPCAPCELRVDRQGWSGHSAAAVALAPTATPIRPGIALAPAGPYQPGQRVRVEGHGFQPPGDGPDDVPPLVLAWCRTGGTADECLQPSVDAPVVDADGGFVVEGVPLPGADVVLFGVTCAEVPGGCSLAWRDSQLGAALGQQVPLDLSG